MNFAPHASAARRLRALFFSGCTIAALFALGVPSAHAAAGATPLPGKATATKQRSASKPLWSELTPAQRNALEPLAGEWDKLDSFRKNKWLAIGNKYSSMKPDEQQRMHDRMRDWVRLTPEQRRIARESYARAKKLDAEQKSEQWEKYQRLPEEQKKKLAADAASKKRVATLPSPATQGKASKTLPPIKSASRRARERAASAHPDQPATDLPRPETSITPR